MYKLNFRRYNEYKEKVPKIDNTSTRNNLKQTINNSISTFSTYKTH